jgi:hypothetical protein
MAATDFPEALAKKDLRETLVSLDLPVYRDRPDREESEVSKGLQETTDALVPMEQGEQLVLAVRLARMEFLVYPVEQVPRESVVIQVKTETMVLMAREEKRVNPGLVEMQVHKERKVPPVKRAPPVQLVSQDQPVAQVFPEL